MSKTAICENGSRIVRTTYRVAPPVPASLRVHPPAHAGNEESAEQDLRGVVDEQRDGDDGQLRVPAVHDLQNWNAWKVFGTGYNQICTGIRKGAAALVITGVSSSGQAPSGSAAATEANM